MSKSFNKLEFTTIKQNHDPLMQAIKLRMASFGWGYNELNEMCEWFVDANIDDEDHWTNMRLW